MGGSRTKITILIAKNAGVNFIIRNMVKKACLVFEREKALLDTFTIAPARRDLSSGK